MQFEGRETVLFMSRLLSGLSTLFLLGSLAACSGASTTQTSVVYEKESHSVASASAVSSSAKEGDTLLQAEDRDEDEYTFQPNAWSNACLLSLEEVNAAVAPLVESGWADDWSEAIAIEDDTSDSDRMEGKRSCSYEGDRFFSVVDITIYPISTVGSFESVCNEVLAGERNLTNVDVPNSCEANLARGTVFNYGGGQGYVYLDESNVLILTLLTIKIGEHTIETIDVLTRILASKV